MVSKVEFLCPNCEFEHLYETAELRDTLSCSRCGEPIHLQLSEHVRSGTQVDQCCVCEGHRFYTQKDFNPRLGLAIFAIGVIFSYHTYGVTLFVASAIDFVLYQVLPTLIVCYRCRALYRGFRGPHKFKPYDPNVAIKYVNMQQREVEADESSS